MPPSVPGALDLAVDHHAGRTTISVAPRIRLREDELVKISCLCGHTIVDNSDFLPYKARFFADQDWEDVTETAERAGNVDKDGLHTPYRQLWSWSRPMWQCAACGRICIDDHDGQLHWFEPTTQSTPRTLLQSIHQEEWKRPMAGGWESWHPEGPRGVLWWGSGGYETYGTWEELERRYHEVFEDLRTKEILRSAYLRREGRILHKWPTDAE